jgi:hypothetical protein
MSTPLTKRRRHRLRQVALALAALVLGLIAGLPWLLALPIAQKGLASAANAILTPGSVEFGVIRLSWIGPTEIDRLVLRDAQGECVLAAPRTVLACNLAQVLFRWPESARLAITQCELDIDRSADGTIDLLETLKPLIVEHPRRRLIIEIPDGRLRFRDPALAAPVLADVADIHLDLTRGWEPITWKIKLARALPPAESGQLAIEGSLSRAEIDSRGNHDLTLAITGSTWPLALRSWGFQSRGDLSATIAASRRTGNWDLAGDATIQGLEATAAAPAPDRIRLADLHAVWKLAGDEASFKIEASGITSSAPFVQLEGTGAVRDLSGTPELDMKGLIRPDWSVLTAELARRVEPNARIAGQPWTWRLSGPLQGVSARSSFEGIRGELEARLDALDVFGMRLGTTVVLLRMQDGAVRIDPIDSTLNGGTLHLEPELAREKDGSVCLRLGRSSVLEGAVVNDEVSHRVLSYAAPILDGATRVRGQISVKLTDAVFPIAAERAAETRITGDVLFDDVRFMPGPLAAELLGIFHREDRPLLVLRDPISVRIAARKVYQNGLVIPLGRAASIGLEGSVDFDKTLDLVASVGMNPAAGNAPVVGSIVKGARIEIPIRGTLDKPRIDGEALRARLASIGSELLQTSLEAGADALSGLLERLPSLSLRGLFSPARRAAPPPPPEPPQAKPMQAPARADPLSQSERRQLRAERKERRLEKQAERRLKRQKSPDSPVDPRGERPNR